MLSYKKSTHFINENVLILVMDIKKKLVSIAIAIIFVLFVGYGIEVFYPGPDQTFTGRAPYMSQEACEEIGGTWSEVEKVEGGMQGFCDEKAIWEKERQQRAGHDRIVFIIAAIVGIVAIITGIVLKTEAVNSGILSGGILLVLYGTIRYWDHANELLKFVWLGIVLGVLIWIGYKKLK